MSQKRIQTNYFSIYIFYFLLIFVQIDKSYSLKYDHEYLGNTSKHLFHFIQITDLHITHAGSEDRMKEFEEFCNHIIKTLVKPRVTIVSGDLVNSVSGSRYGRESLLETEQYEEEWKIYRNILNRTNVTRYTKWLDLKGNHDTFMDSDPDSSKSFYRIYSHQGHEHSGSYEYTINTKDGDKYSFISIDMCPRPGLGRPFNFFGYLNQNERTILKKLSEKNQNSTSIIYFGHYPLSFTYSSKLDDIMKYGIVYLNGHLHSIKHLYDRHTNGLLELELGDWKRKRQFRIVIIDGGLLSFEDYHYGQSIYAVISNPKPAKFHTKREPFYRLSQSTHIRIVIFSKFSILNVTISIDGTYLGSAIRSIDNKNLYILPWNTSFYSDNYLHKIYVEIKDNETNSIQLEHEFSLSLSTVTKWNPWKFLLTIHQPTFGFFFFLTSLCGYILILFYYRYESKQKRFQTNGRFLFWNRFRLRMILLCSVDFIFYSLITFAFYHFIGPWYLGYLTDGHFGVIFLWGIFIKNVYLPPDTQTFVGTFQLYFCVFPLTYSLSSLCYYRYQQSINQQRSCLNRCSQIYSVYILFIYTIILTFLWSFLMTVSYKFSWFISPFGLILGIFFFVLYVKLFRLKIEDFKFKLSSEINQNNEDNSNLHLMKSL